jgi:hypothetical protein
MFNILRSYLQLIHLMKNLSNILIRVTGIASDLKIGFLTKEQFIEQASKEHEFKPLGDQIYNYEMLETPGLSYEV